MLFALQKSGCCLVKKIQNWSQEQARVCKQISTRSQNGYLFHLEWLLHPFWLLFGSVFCFSFCFVFFLFYTTSLKLILSLQGCFSFSHTVKKKSSKIQKKTQLLFITCYNILRFSSTTNFKSDF